MSAGFSLQLTKDTLTPDLRTKLRAAKQPTRVLQAIGTGIAGLAKEAFNNASLRPAPWVGKFPDGAKATLKSREASLWRSIKVQSVNAREVKVGSDKIYAAIHQLGGVIKPRKGPWLIFKVNGVTYRAKKVTIPPRPYMPFYSDGTMTPPAERRTRDIIETALQMRAR